MFSSLELNDDIAKNIFKIMLREDVDDRRRYAILVYSITNHKLCNIIIIISSIKAVIITLAFQESGLNILQLSKVFFESLDSLFLKCRFFSVVFFAEYPSLGVENKGDLPLSAGISRLYILLRVTRRANSSSWTVSLNRVRPRMIWRLGRMIRRTSTWEMRTYPVTSRMCWRKLRSRFSSWSQVSSRLPSTKVQLVYRSRRFLATRGQYVAECGRKIGVLAEKG